MSEVITAPYDNIRQAYQHLLKFENKPPYEYRDDDNWVVVYFDKTLSIKLFPTLELVGKWFPWSIYKSEVFVCPEQLSQKLTTSRLIEIYNHQRYSVSEKTNSQLKPPIQDELNGQTLKIAKMVWEQFQIVGDRVTRKQPQITHGSRENHDKYTIRIDLLKSVDYYEKINRLAKQAKIIAQAFADEEKTSYTEDELTSFSRQLAFTGKLKTKQDPLRVVKYYCPTLADMGLMSYPTKRNNSDDGEE